MNRGVTSLKFVVPKTSQLDSEEATKRAQTILAEVVDEEKTLTETRELLSESSLRKSKRKRKQAPGHDCVQEELFTDEMVSILEGLISESCKTSCSTGLESLLLGDPDRFKDTIASLGDSEFQVQKFLNVVDHLQDVNDEVVQNIVALVERGWVCLEKLEKVMADGNFNKVGYYIITKGNECTQQNLRQLLCSDPCQKTRLIFFVTKIITESTNVDTKFTMTLTVSASDVIPALLQHEPKSNIEELYSSQIEVYRSVQFQIQIERITGFLDSTPFEQILGILKSTSDFFESNPTLFSALWCYILLKSDNMVANLDFLSEFLWSSLSCQNRHNFILSLLLMRVLDITGKRSYPESFQIYFGNGSTHITSSKSVEFIIDILTSLVPHEIGSYLKHHIQISLRGGAKFKEKLDHYVMLARTRMKDFNLIEIDKNVANDVEKAIKSFKKRNAIPSSVIEASIFKKQYYTNHFLPFLLKEKSVDDEPGRLSLVSALVSANKIPKSVKRYSEPEVQEITQTESLSEAILSLPSTGSDAKDRIYRMCSSACDEPSLMLLIKTVCLECPNIEATDFLGDFASLKHLKQPFVNCVKTLILNETRPCEILSLLQLIDDESNEMIIKSMILKDKIMFRILPKEQELLYLPIIILGKADTNPQFTLSDDTAKKISIVKLCQVLDWWPYDRDRINRFQSAVYRIFDRITSNQSCNHLCTDIFKCCLTLNILPFVMSTFLTLIPIASFTQLWVYDALAQVLLPLYQGNSEKPVAKIQEIFRRFFKLVNVLKPSLLYRCGALKSIDNLLSVLDSYKIYITNSENHLLDYPITLTIVRSVQDAVLFNTLCERSSTFLISCVFYIEELSKARESNVMKSNKLILRVVGFLKKLEKGGVSSNDVPEEQICPQIGVSWFLVFAEKHISDFSGIRFSNPIAEGYITAMFYCYSNLWLSGSLRENHLTSFGELCIRSTHYHTSYTAPLLEKCASSNEVLAQHFSGYKIGRIFPLLYLGGVASCCIIGFDKSYSEAVMPLARKAYQQSQRLVYDSLSTMQSMQEFMVSLVRQQDSEPLTTAARQFVSSLCRTFSLTDDRSF